jgi:ferredoxin-type protein NapH
MVVETIPKTVGFIYALIMIFVIAYLWYGKKWQQKIGRVLLAISALMGFLVFAPVVPYQFQQLVLGNAQEPGAPLIVGVAGLLVILLLSLMLGRFFCGYLCPVGTVQEIAYHAPVPKIVQRYPRALMVVRTTFFIVFLTAAILFSASLLAWFGIKDFFYLSLTTGSLVFAAIVILSFIFYRPFCRLVCPYGFLLALAAAKSRCKIERTDACIECKKCEKVCPTDESKRDDTKAECYLCGRCMEVCPEDALVYRRITPGAKKPGI